MALIGMGGSVTIGATPYPVETWTYTGSNELQDVTDTGAAGWTTRIAGVSSGELQLTMFYNQASPQIGTITIGTSFAFSAQVGTIAPTQDTIAGTFLVSSVSVENPAKNPVKVNITAQSTGSVTITAAAA